MIFSDCLVWILLNNLGLADKRLIYAPRYYLFIVCIKLDYSHMQRDNL